MKRDIKWGRLLSCALIPLAVGGAAALLTMDGMKQFDTISKPLLTPPAWAFPAVWTVLYLLMGLASYIVLSSDASPVRKERALTVYALQLAANFIWTMLFFGAGLFFGAFLWIILLWLLILMCTALFMAISKTAGKLLLPYLLWVSFAAYLNLGIYLLN